MIFIIDKKLLKMDNKGQELRPLSGYEYIENQLQESLYAIKRLKQKDIRTKRMNENEDQENFDLNKDMIVDNLEKIRGRINKNINKDIQSMNNYIHTLKEVKKRKNIDIDNDIFYVTGLKNDNLDSNKRKIKKTKKGKYTKKLKEDLQMKVLNSFPTFNKEIDLRPRIDSDLEIDERSRSRPRIDSEEERFNKLNKIKTRMKKYVNSIKFIRSKKTHPEYIYNDYSKSRSSSDDSTESNILNLEKISDKINTLQSIYDICQKVSDTVKS